MENFRNNPEQENSFFENNISTHYLLETARWGKFIAILGFIGMGIVLLFSVLMVMGINFSGEADMNTISMKTLLLIYILLIIIYFFPVISLYKFSVKMKHGIETKNMEEMTLGFKNLKSLFKFIGILAIISISIYAISFFAFLAFATSMNLAK